MILAFTLLKESLLLLKKRFSAYITIIIYFFRGTACSCITAVVMPAALRSETRRLHDTYG